jgi:predicted N-acetyltransferase YhbS
MTTSATSPEQVSIRRATPADAAPCGRIAYDAFASISNQHNFPLDFPNAKVAAGVLTMMFSHPKVYGVVAEMNGRIVGSNCLDERTIIGGIGPITVDPKIQNRGVGRALMDAVIARGMQSTPAGQRLVQAAYHNRSMSLYTKLGFDVREPLSVMHGKNGELHLKDTNAATIFMTGSLPGTQPWWSATEASPAMPQHLDFSDTQWPKPMRTCKP